LNTQPSEATYQLLSSPSTPLHTKTIEEVESSRLVHISTEAIGKAMPGTDGDKGEAGENEKDDEGENEKDEEGELPDHDERSIAKTRPPREGDGVLEVEELVKMMQEILPAGATSTLSSTTSADHAPADDSAGSSTSGTETFGSRGGLNGMTGVGKDEPAYTCYTPLFKLTLGTPRDDEHDS
jgi:RNA exonuclease NGL2